jgi:hypothetical protein
MNLKDLVGVECPAHKCSYTVCGHRKHHDEDYNYFSIYTVRTEDLKSYCEFVDKITQLLSYSRKKKTPVTLPSRETFTADVSRGKIIFSLPN